MNEIITSPEGMTTDELLALPVHPLAAMFPLLPADELDDLAEDITANGLQHPIIIGPSQLIDGRNRLAACKIAGIKVPPVIAFTGTEAEAAALIIGENVNRRHLTPSQRTMATAFAYPEPITLKRAGSLAAKHQADINKGALSQARTVLREDPFLAGVVMTGTISVEAAYRTVRGKINKQDEETVAKERLRIEAPDLYRQVERDGLSIADAITKLNARIEHARVERQRHTDYLNRALTILNMPAEQTPEDWAKRLFPLLDVEFFNAPNCQMDAASIRRAAAMLSALADLFQREE